MTDAAEPRDPFAALRIADEPLPPRPGFATDLRNRLIDELGDTTMSSTTPSTGASAGAAVAARAKGLTPYLIVRNGVAALDFYRDAFGAVEQQRFLGNDGRIGHAEIRIGTSTLMLADEHPEHDIVGPQTRGGPTCSFNLDVDDVDAAYAAALALGATSEREPADQFYGDRSATVSDPFGHRWILTAPAAEMSTEEYVAAAAEEGYTATVVPSTDNGASELSESVADHQVKHYDPGDLYYFTLAVGDLAKAQMFFSAVLGWEFAAPEAGHVSNISAPPGGVLAAPAPAATRLWFVVDDIHVAVAKVREMGGTSEEPVEYDSGWSADCTDDQGTPFSLSVPAAKYRR